MSKNTIKIKKYLDVIEEYEAGGTITPGMLLEVTSDDEVIAHSDAGGVCNGMFALEDELQGNGVDDDYSDGDQVQCWVAVRGEMVYALLEDGESVSIGDKLVSAGNGKLQATGDDSSGADINEYVIAEAVEAVDASDSTGEDSDVPRILVRVL